MARTHTHTKPPTTGIERAFSYTPTLYNTSLLREEPGGWCAPKAGATIEVGHEKKVDLGVLRGADHDGLVLVSPFSTVDGVRVKFTVTL